MRLVDKQIILPLEIAVPSFIICLDLRPHVEGKHSSPVIWNQNLTLVCSLETGHAQPHSLCFQELEDICPSPQLLREQFWLVIQDKNRQAEEFKR